MKRVLLAAVAMAAIAASTQAIAADLPAPVPAMAPEPVASVFSWSGFYIGVHAGGAWSDGGSDDGCGRFTNITAEGGGAPTFDSAEDIVDVPADGFGGFGGNDFPEGCGVVEISDGDPATNVESEAFNLDGDYVAFESGDGDGDDLEWLGGAQLGINQQYGRLVLGLEADFAWLGGNDDDDELTFGYFHDYDNACIADCLIDQEGTGSVSGGNGIDWLATFRGRVGGALLDEGRLLAFVTGGVALAGVDGSTDADFDTDEVVDGANEVDFCGGGCTFTGNDDDDDYRVGFTIGAGAEYAFNNNVSFGLQYLYVHFEDEGSSSVTFNADDGRSFDIESNDSLDSMHIVTARLNWLFGPGTP